MKNNGHTDLGKPDDFPFTKPDIWVERFLSAL